MSELVAHKADVTIPVYGTIADAEVYLKYEADKVIAEKDKEIAELKSEITDLRDDKKSTDTILDERNAEIAELKADYKEACDRLQTANLIKDEQLGATRHQKYKRCLAMVRWCGYWAEYWDCCEPSDCSKFIANTRFYHKWRKRWLELAEKFKPNNSTAQ